MFDNGVTVWEVVKLIGAVALTYVAIVIAFCL